MSRTFEKPSDLFRWSLRCGETRNPIYRYADCFPEYWRLADQDGYLWEQYDRRLSHLIATVRPNTRILEVGSGFGHDAHWAALKGATVTGIDVKSDFVEISRELTASVESETGVGLEIRFERTNLLDMPDHPFDFIFMKDVFHHLEPRDQVFAKLARLLAPSGKILIVEPNALNPLIQWQMFRIRGLNTVIDKLDQTSGERFVYGNERLLTGRALRKGFEVQGVAGSTELFRFLPTALCSRPEFVITARRLESLGLEKLAPAACIHCVFLGQRMN